MSGDLHALYQGALRDHSRAPRNRRAIAGARTGEGHIPICGDHVTVYVRVEDGTLRDVAFEGTGCAVSLASASLMTETVRDKTVRDAAALIDQLQHALRSPPGSPVDDLGELAPLGGVRQFPIRIRCALLAWDALRAALADQLTRR